MIRYFKRQETDFNHNETILKPISCYIIEEANGMFELEAEFPKNISISKGDIIKAPSPRGEQLFRIYRYIKTLTGKKVYARHIFYDLSKNFLININLDSVSGFSALKKIINSCEISHNFVGISNVLVINSASYERVNPVQAIIGDNNSILNTWGGNLIRDNHSIRIENEGTDRGYEIRLGKNLIGIEDDSDESAVKTRLYPTVVLGDNDSLYSIPEKYVDSPLINNYGDPIIYPVEVSLSDEQKELSMEEIYEIMRNYCLGLFEVGNIDKPVINYKVDFIELSKTEQYKDLAILEKLDLYDLITVNVSHLDINVKARCIKYKYDCLKERYTTIELGDFSQVSRYTTDGIVSQINNRLKVNESAVEYATNVITGNKGGYVVTRRYPNGKPYEILIMDTEDINTAENVFRLNNSGLGFSRNGYNGSYDTAMTIDGHIVADYIDTGTLTSILLESSNYIANSLGMKINLADGTIDSKNFKVSSNGNITANNAIMNNGTFSGSLNAATGSFSGQITGGSMNINNNFIVNSAGYLTANSANLSGSFTTTGIVGNNTYTTTIQHGFIQTDLLSSNAVFVGNLGMSGGKIFAGNNTSMEDGLIYSNQIIGANGSFTNLNINGSAGLSVGNLVTQCTANNIVVPNASNSSSCTTGWLSLSGGTLQAPNGSLWIGQNTVRANTIEQLSSVNYKKNINIYDGCALDLICNTTIKTYNYLNEEDDLKVHLGMIVEEAPIEVVSEGGESLDIGAVSSLAWKAIQEQQVIINSQSNEINRLKDQIIEFEKRLCKLEVA